MARQIHVANSGGRNTRVAVTTLPPVVLEGAPGVPGRNISFRRFLACTTDARNEAMTARFGDDYSQQLIEGDPEVDMESVGRFLADTSTLYVSADGTPLKAAPVFLEVVLAPDGTEKERRSPVDVPSNINTDLPIKWTGKKFPIADAVSRFVFRRRMQITHIDGLTFDFLHAMAKELAAEGVLMLVGGGAKGVEPLVFQANGKPFRGFLEGRVDGEKYALILHLSDLELKAPAAKEAAP